MQQLFQSFKEMAQANKELAAAATAARTGNNPAADNATPANNDTQITDTSRDAGAGAVAAMRKSGLLTSTFGKRKLLTGWMLLG